MVVCLVFVDTYVAKWAACLSCDAAQPFQNDISALFSEKQAA